MLGNSSVAAQLAASEEGLSSMELVSYLWMTGKSQFDFQQEGKILPFSGAS
jgi:hypothetical protein